MYSAVLFLLQKGERVTFQEQRTSLVITLLFLSQNSFHPIGSGDKVNQYTVPKTDQPDICKECFDNDPVSKTSDGRGLAIIAVLSTERKAAQFHGQIFNPQESISKATLKHALDECAGHSLLARDAFLGVINDVLEIAFDSTKCVVVQEIPPFANCCVEHLANCPLYFKRPVVMQFSCKCKGIQQS